MTSPEIRAAALATIECAGKNGITVPAIADELGVPWRRIPHHLRALEEEKRVWANYQEGSLPVWRLVGVSRWIMYSDGVLR